MQRPQCSQSIVLAPHASGAGPRSPRSRWSCDGAVDYTVRVSRPGGAPVDDADVRLRGTTTDGQLVEARLDPAGEPGVYQGLVAFSARGPRGLTLRVARGDGVVEMPVGPAP